MTHMYFLARTEGRISYGHLGRTNSCFWLYRYSRMLLCARTEISMNNMCPADCLHFILYFHVDMDFAFFRVVFQNFFLFLSLSGLFRRRFLCQIRILWRSGPPSSWGKRQASKVRRSNVKANKRELGFWRFGQCCQAISSLNLLSSNTLTDHHSLTHLKLAADIHRKCV